MFQGRRPVFVTRERGGARKYEASEGGGFQSPDEADCIRASDTGAVCLVPWAVPGAVEEGVSGARTVRAAGVVSPVTGLVTSDTTSRKEGPEGSLESFVISGTA